MAMLNKDIYYILGLFILSALACEREVTTTTLTVTCPSNLSIELLSKTVPANTINLPLPMVVTNCGTGDFAYTTNLPDTIHAGIYNVDYYISNSCDNKDTCSFQLAATYDYRKPYIGTYIGNQHCDFGSNTDSIINVIVTLGLTPDKVNVGGDEVIIDSTGKFPYPTCCGYRWFSLKFFPDSVHVVKITGSLHQEFRCDFYGKKQ